MDPVTDEGLFKEPSRMRRLGPVARRTKMRMWLMEIGLHPLSTVVRRSLKIRRNETCGTCAFCQPLDRDVPVSRTTYKCWFDQGRRVTRGSATDIRKSWPACTDWRPSDDRAPTDEPHLAA